VRSISRLRSAWRAWFRRADLDRDLEAELGAAVGELAARYARRGLSKDAARRAALIELGGLEQVKEQVRDARTTHGLDTALGDVRLAWRMFRRSPVFAVTSILTLAIGIGATTAIFTVVNAMLIEIKRSRAWPVPDLLIS
jgi:VIT1/CCC1 family predicted Fe2+/Mn2+ transporter